MNKELISRCIKALRWMLADIDFRNAQTGIDDDKPDSPEVADVRKVLIQLEAEL